MTQKRISICTPAEPVSVSNDEYSNTISVSGGIGSHITTESFNDDLKLIIITPATLATSYKYVITETTSGRTVDKSRIAMTGESIIIKNYAMYDDTLTISITDSSKNEDFTLRVRHA